MMNKGLLFGFFVVMILALVVGSFLGNSIIRDVDSTHPDLNVYLTTGLLVDGHAFLGSSDAPLSLLYVVDLESEESREHFGVVVPYLVDSFVNSKQARLYFKHYIPRPEFDEKNGRFIYSVMTSCYAELGGNDLVRAHELLYSTKDVSSFKEEFGLSEAFDDCLLSEPESSLDDAVESLLLRIEAPSVVVGIGAKENTAVYGTDVDDINQTIRNKQVMIGI